VEIDNEQEAGALMVSSFRGGRVVQESAATRIAQVRHGRANMAHLKQPQPDLIRENPFFFHFRG
jgi:hypothetical protein